MNPQDTIEKANAQIAGINKTAGTKIPVITATGLSQNPTPAVVPPPPPATAAAGLTGALDSTTNDFTKRLADNAAGAKTSADDSLKQLLSALGGGTSEFTDAAYSANGVDQAQSGLSEVNSQILAEKNALNHKVETLKANPQGFFGTGLQQEIDRVTNESLSKQADLAVIQLAKQGQFDSAKAIADRAVAAQTEARQNKITALQAVYEANKDLFSTAEQQQFEADQTKRNGDLELERSEKLADYNAKIKAADPLYRAQLAKAQTDAAATSGAAPGPLQLAKAQGNITAVSNLLSDKNLAAAVGPNALARTSFTNLFTGGKSNFVAGVEQLRSQLSLDSLINAKANGATFGALSEGELKLLSDSGSKLSSWAVKDSNGNVIGYKANEADFKAELDKINNYSKLDYLLKGGSPEDVGVQVTGDGRYWTLNSDGTVTELK